MAFYSPFTYVDGRPKTVFELVPEDVHQLFEKNVEDGWQIHYAATLSQRIPEIISSFANELGGWLFIGIDGGTRELAWVEKQDYASVLYELMRGLVSPVPKIEVCFLETDTVTNQGVVVVWVPEGNRPPYICNGSIYRRNGSGTIPLKHCDHLDKLYQKAEEMQVELKDFCRNELTVNNSQWNSQIFRYIDRGMCNIYLIPIYPLKLLDKMRPDDWISNVLSGSKKSMVLRDADEHSLTASLTWSKGYYSANSLIFRNSPFLDHYRHSIAWELFGDGRSRFHIPIPYLDLELHMWQNVKDVQKKDILNDFDYIDGKEFLTKVIGCIGYYIQTMKKYFPEFSEMQVVVELENVERDVLCFKGDTYLRFLRNQGMVFSEKNRYFINYDFASRTVSLDLNEMMEYISPIFNAFGLSVKNGINFFYEVIGDSVDHLSYVSISR